MTLVAHPDSLLGRGALHGSRERKGRRYSLAPILGLVLLREVPLTGRTVTMDAGLLIALRWLLAPLMD